MATVENGVGSCRRSHGNSDARHLENDIKPNQIPQTYRRELFGNFVQSEKGEKGIEGLRVGRCKENIRRVDGKEEGSLVCQVLILEHFSREVVESFGGKDEEGVAEEDGGELETGDKADDGIVLLQPVEANGKGADQERVEGEESQICFKSVTVVGYVQEMSTIPPDESMNKQKLR